MPDIAATNQQAPPTPMASMLGAGAGGFLLIVGTLPFLLIAALPPVLDPEVAPYDPPAALTVVVATLVALGTPTFTAMAIALRQEANVRITVLLVAVPQLVLCTPLSVLYLWTRS